MVPPGVERHCFGATVPDRVGRSARVEDTISILRGLRERFEIHHGVNIRDEALVNAAVLSNRYISDALDKQSTWLTKPVPRFAPA